MKPLVTTAVVALLAAGSAFAQVSDADGDGVFSLAEIQAAYPDVTEDAFAAIDTDGDGAVSVDELAAAEEAGVLTPS